MKPNVRRSHLHLNDLRGASRLSIDAVLGITSLVETMHATIAQPTLPLGKGGKESAGEEQLPWLAKLNKLIFLGTPHHGAPMEQGGNWIDVALQLSPYSKAFARLTNVRSAGITDLRHGNLLDADWHERDRFQRSPPPAHSVPLPGRVACYAAAATMAQDAADCRGGLLGDGLVMVPSALGKHKKPARSLRISVSRQWLGYGMNHWDLLSRPEVAEQLGR